MNEASLPTTALVAVRRKPMTYRELTMIDIREVLRRWTAGHSNRRIARETGTDRGTVARYIASAEEAGVTRAGVVALTDAEVHEIAQRVQARPLAERSQEWSTVAAHKDLVVQWLEAKRPLRLSKIHTLLVRDHGLQASYDTLRRFAKQELGWHKKAPTVRLEDPPPGQEAQVDFGKMGTMLDAATGRVRVLWALIVTLAFSRYQFVWPTFVQSTEAVCEGLDRAWWFFGGMPSTLIPDNLKAIVKIADALNPTLSAAFLDYVQARGIFVDPARVRSPKDKPRVENQVSFVRESWFDGETFADLDDARRHAEHWCREIAGLRVHGTTRKVPREVLDSIEKATLLPPPAESFDVPLWVDEAKVHPDHHIQVARALYSVPTLYLHKKVRARVDRTSVRIYFGTQLIKVHPRQAPGGRSTDTRDYPVGKAAYALRSVDAIVARAKEKGAHIGMYAERLLGGPLPWTRMRQTYSLLRLCDKYGDGRVEAVCQSALAFDVVDVTRITRMLKKAAKPVTPKVDKQQRKLVQLTLPRFARSEQHFETRSGSKKEEGV
jgi:transposase